MYSCRNIALVILWRSSSRNSGSIHGHSSAVALIRCHCLPPPVHSVQKNPRLPLGVLISHRSPFPTASAGRIARYSLSSTRDASSISINDTLENPRDVFSLCGSPTIRDRFGNAIEISFVPSPRTLIPSRLTNSSALRINSPLCLSLGASTSIRLSGRQYARCTAFAAATVDLPHCRVQFTMPRRPPRSTDSCSGFGSKPSRCRVNSTISGISSDLPSAPPIKSRRLRVNLDLLPDSDQNSLII